MARHAPSAWRSMPPHRHAGVTSPRRHATATATRARRLPAGAGTRMLSRSRPHLPSLPHRDPTQSPRPRRRRTPAQSRRATAAREPDPRQRPRPHGGRRRPVAQAVGIAGNRIVAVGTTAEVERAAAPNARRIDLQGRTVTPGCSTRTAHFARGGTSQMLSLDVGFPAVKERGRDGGGGEGAGCHHGQGSVDQRARMGRGKSWPRSVCPRQPISTPQRRTTRSTSRRPPGTTAWRTASRSGWRA